MPCRTLLLLPALQNRPKSPKIAQNRPKLPARFSDTSSLHLSLKAHARGAARTQHRQTRSGMTSVVSMPHLALGAALGCQTLGAPRAVARAESRRRQLPARRSVVVAAASARGGQRGEGAVAGAVTGAVTGLGSSQDEGFDLSQERRRSAVERDTADTLRRTIAVSAPRHTGYPILSIVLLLVLATTPRMYSARGGVCPKPAPLTPAPTTAASSCRPSQLWHPP